MDTGEPSMRQITAITIKRKHIDPGARDKYGHWWFEMGHESYGWWPKHPVGSWNTLIGVAGELNGTTSFNGRATRDPHHGDEADEEFHPIVDSDDKRAESSIMDCLRKFALSYSGDWRWTFGLGQNCHTFQEAAMRHCKLHIPR